MNQHILQSALVELALPEIRYYASTGSTNDLAAEWASQGAPNLALVVANEQTQGRGRAGRRWYTPAGAGLAMSLVLRPENLQTTQLPQLTALGALAVTTTLKTDFQLPAEIKWPNDVLVRGKKTCGVLVELHWQGDSLSHAVLGIGVNVTPGAVPAKANLIFPATDLESELNQPVNRVELLKKILTQLITWRARLGSIEFLQAWKLHLAYMGRPVTILRDNQEVLKGTITGLTKRGALQLRNINGTIEEVAFGEVQLRPQ